MRAISGVCVGDQVRLVALHGVASESMRRCLGQTGVATGECRSGPAGHTVEVRFAPGPSAEPVEDYWLRPGEWILVERAATLPEELPMESSRMAIVRPPQEVRPVMADFASAVQTRIDQLTADDAALEAQVQELQARRAVLGQERKALGAAVATYNRVRGGSAVPARAPVGARHALPSMEFGAKKSEAVAFLREWAAGHDRLVVAEIGPVAGARGIARDNLIYALKTSPDFERVERGVYSLRADEVR